MSPLLLLSLVTGLAFAAWLGLLIAVRRRGPALARLWCRVDVCWVCGYEIDPDAMSPACPECGTPINVAQSEVSQWKYFRRKVRWFRVMQFVSIVLVITWTITASAIIQLLVRTKFSDLPTVSEALIKIAHIAAILGLSWFSHVPGVPQVIKPRENR